MTPAEILHWIRSNEASLCVTTDDSGRSVGWVARTPMTGWVNGKTPEDAIEQLRKLLEESL